MFYNIGNPKDGDYNNDGRVDTADYTVWRDHLGQTTAGNSYTLPNEALDVDGNPTTPGTVDQQDYTAWRNRFGTKVQSVNDWYATAPHDADGFATYSVPVTSPSGISHGFYYGYGSQGPNQNDVVTNGGRVQNADGSWSDVINGFGANFQNFGGGPANPADPSSKLNTPNGVPLIFMGSPRMAARPQPRSQEHLAQRITPGPVVARMDANSGITFRFGSGFQYQGQGYTDAMNMPQPPVVQPPIMVNGTPYDPTATDQISRFDANGMTNLIFNERTPDNPNEVNRFVLRSAPRDVGKGRHNSPVDHVY